ncbi:MAG: TonB family protein [Pseudomonadota bacterium]
MSLPTTKGSRNRGTLAALLLLGALVSTLFVPRAEAVARAITELIDVPPDVAATPEGEQLQNAQTQFRAYLAEREFDEALEQAKSVVELSARIWGGETRQVSQALTNLAIAQSESADHSAAQQNFLSAIETLQAVDGGLVGEGLINPLKGLANTSIAMNDLEGAVPLFERAVHISHVTAGPNNLEQLDSLDSLSRTHFFLGDIRTANRIQDIMYRLQQRRFSADSDQYIDALTRRARWYAMVGDFTEATFAFRRLERTIVKFHGKDDPRLIEPLLELAFVAPRQSTATPGLTPELALKEARRAVHRAVRIARVQSENDPTVLPKTLTAEGDFLLYATATRTARDSYQEAYSITVNNRDLEGLHQELFGEPVPVIRVPIRNVYHVNTTESAMGTYPDRGFVALEFDLNINGRPENIRVLDSVPAGLMDTDVIRKVRRFVFRPGFENGVPTSYQGLTFRHDFRYDERRLTQSEKEYIERIEKSRASRPAPEIDDNMPSNTTLPGQETPAPEI